MRSMRRSVLIILALVLTAMPASADAVAELDPPVVAGKTRVVATQTSRLQVRVPSEAYLNIESVERNGEYRVPALDDIEGEGRLLGFALAADPGDGEDLDIVALQLPQKVLGEVHVALGSKAREDRNTTDPTGCFRCRIPPGEYTLYVIADREPVAVTINFEGLEGETELVASRPVPMQQEHSEVSENTATVPGRAEYSSAGVTGALPSDGMRVDVAYFGSGMDPVPVAGYRGGAGQYGRCRYGATLPPVAPGCPGGQNDGPALAASASGGYYYVGFTRAANLGAGSSSVGAYAVHAGLDIGVGGVAAFWMAYE